MNRLKSAPPHVPPHIALPHVVTRGVKLPGQEAGYLGTALGPFEIHG